MVVYFIKGLQLFRLLSANVILPKFFFRLKEQIYCQNSPKIAYLCSSWLKHSCQYPYWNEHCCFLLFVFIFLLGGYGRGKKGGRKKNISICSDNQLVKTELIKKTCLKLFVHTSEEHLTEMDIFRHLRLTVSLGFLK